MVVAAAMLVESNHQQGAGPVLARAHRFPDALQKLLAQANVMGRMPVVRLKLETWFQERILRQRACRRVLFKLS